MDENKFFLTKSFIIYRCIVLITIYHIVYHKSNDPTKKFAILQKRWRKEKSDLPNLRSDHFYASNEIVFLSSEACPA